MIPDPIKKLLTEKNQLKEEIDLSNYGLNDEDMSELERLLEDNTQIVSINLERNNITSEGLESLTGIKYLKKLNLAKNKINDEGIEYLIKNNQRLTWLNLRDNAITNSSAELLLEKLSAKGTLTYVDIGENRNIDNETIRKIDCLSENRTYSPNQTITFESMLDLKQRIGVSLFPSDKISLEKETVSHKRKEEELALTIINEHPEIQNFSTSELQSFTQILMNKRKRAANYI